VAHHLQQVLEEPFHEVDPAVASENEQVGDEDVESWLNRRTALKIAGDFSPTLTGG